MAAETDRLLWMEECEHALALQTEARRDFTQQLALVEKSSLLPQTAACGVKEVKERGNE